MTKNSLHLADTDAALTRGRKFAAEDVALLLLSLLAEGAAHGYALRQSLQARSQGYYVPSPGVLYPALALLQAQGWAAVRAQGTRKSYEATADGMAHLHRHQPRVARLWARLDHAARKTAWLRRAWAGEAPVLGPEGEDQATGWLPEFVAARSALREALMLRTRASPAEQQQLARILARTVADIDAACPLLPTGSPSS